MVWIKKYQEFQKLVEEKYGINMPIGICNISIENLKLLIDNKCRVDIIQNEYHPFLFTEVPKYCKENNILFEAHSIMTNIHEYNKYIGEVDLMNNISYGGLAVLYATIIRFNMFKTSNYVHLKEIIDYNKIPVNLKEIFLKMKEFYKYRKIVRYNGSGEINYNWIESCDKNILKNEILPQLIKDIEDFNNNKIPSDLCEKIPKFWRKMVKFIQK